MGKEKSPSKKEVPKETYLHHDPAPADSVGSAGRLKSASALQVSVFTLMLENLTGAFLI